MEHYKFLDPHTVFKKYDQYIQNHINDNSKIYDFVASKIELLPELFSKPVDKYELLQNSFEEFKQKFLSIHSIVLHFQKQYDFTFCYESLFIDTKYINISNFIPNLVIRYEKKFYTLPLQLHNKIDFNIHQELIPMYEIIQLENIKNIELNIFNSCIFDSNKLQEVFKSIISEFSEYQEYVNHSRKIFNYCTTFETYLCDSIDFIVSNKEIEDLDCLFKIYYDTEITLELINEHPLLKYYTGNKNIYSLDFIKLFNDLYNVFKLKKQLEVF